jgi:hypothetical protein
MHARRPLAPYDLVWHRLAWLGGAPVRETVEEPAMSPAAELKDKIAETRFRDEGAAVADCLQALTLDSEARERISAAAAERASPPRRRSWSRPCAG